MVPSWSGAELSKLWDHGLERHATSRCLEDTRVPLVTAHSNHRTGEVKEMCANSAPTEKGSRAVCLVLQC